MKRPAPDRSHGNDEHAERRERTLVIVVPVLREANGLRETVAHMNTLTSDPRRIVLVTTEKEALQATADVPSTIAVAEVLASDGLCTHLHAPTREGVKADQLNWVASKLTELGHNPESTYVVIYDADSRPPSTTFNAFADAIAHNPGAPILHTSSHFELRRRAVTGRLAAALGEACALRANRFVLGFEIPRLRARSSSVMARRAAGRCVFAHVTGHGLCVRLDYLLAHPLPAGDPIEDMHWSFHACARGDSMIPVAELDRAEVPDTVAAQFRQARRWFSGPARSVHYLREQPRPLALKQLVIALSGVGSAVEWLACAPVPALLLIDTVRPSVPAVRRVVAAVTGGVVVAQLVAVDTAAGWQSAPRTVARVALSPVAFAIHGIGGCAGATDIARSRYRTDKTERV